jgi:hypothetical protein
VTFYLYSLARVSLEPLSVSSNDALSCSVYLVRIESEMDVLERSSISTTDISLTGVRAA